MASEQWILFITQVVISVGSLNRRVHISLLHPRVEISIYQFNMSTSE